MIGYFVTGAGTEIGKTFVTCRLVRELKAAGKGVRAVKPVISGFDPETVSDSDTGLLLAAMEDTTDAAAVGAVSPWRFADPISPDMAAAREGQAARRARNRYFLPLRLARRRGRYSAGRGDRRRYGAAQRKETVLDWMEHLGWPAILVAGSYLGALSHCLTAASAIRAKGLQLAGIVVSESKENPVPLAETVATIRNFSGDVPVVALPRNAPPGDPDLSAALFS